jgi:DNA invertase Pin-like site-specific DNA recombinase
VDTKLRRRTWLVLGALGTFVGLWIGALETSKSLGIEFGWLSEQVDTRTPTGKMVFTVLGAVSELERSLIAERVRAGLRNAKAKGKRLGRPRVDVDVARIAKLRSEGRSWIAIANEMGIGKRP